MARSSSDTDSPKSTSSSSSSRSSADEDGERRRKIQSPTAAVASSDESTTSDGVLVEIPGNHDHVQDREQDGGVLVNIDGSMQEGRDDLFVDASEELGSARSAALVEYEGESSSMNDNAILKLRERFDEVDAQCRKYKEEREIFGRDVSNLRHQLQEFLANQVSSGTSTEEAIEFLNQTRKGVDDDETLMSPTPLHAMVNDCSKILSHCNASSQSNPEDTINKLHTIISDKEKEVEEIKLNLAQSNTSQVTGRLLASIEAVIGTENFSSDDPFGDGISLLERRIQSLLEQHTQLLSATQYLGKLLAETRPELVNAGETEFSFIYSTVGKELVDSRRREGFLSEKISELENENRRITETHNAEINKTKAELEQADKKLATAREKLTIAVTKGKSLVQHRDALRQSLAEKTDELEKCMFELQEKSSALEILRPQTEEMKQKLDEKRNELEIRLLELQQKSTALETAETINQSLADKITELENSMQEKFRNLQILEVSTEELKRILAEKTNELENLSLELQHKSAALVTSENVNSEINQSLAEKISELDKCMLVLQEKTNALETSEVNTKKLKQQLSDKAIELEDCLLELQHKSTALETSENIISEIKQSLVEKTNEFEKRIHESEMNRTHAERELEEIKSETTKLSEAFATVESLKKELSLKEENIVSISQEREELKISIGKVNEDCSMQASKLEDANATIRSLEDRLSNMTSQEVFEKPSEERSMFISKLEDSTTTIKSLEDELAQSTKSISNLEAEKIEIKLNLQQQVDALNAELSAQLENLHMIVSDESLLSLMTEEFRKKIAVLSNTGSLVQDLHNQFITRGLHSQTDFKGSDFAKFLSLPKFEEFMNNVLSNKSNITEELHDASALSTYIEKLKHKSTLHRNCFHSFSQYEDDYIGTISHDMKAAHDEFIHMLELTESLKQNMVILESENQAYKTKISSLTEDTSSLHSACQEAIQELQIEFNNLMEFNKEQGTGKSDLYSETIEECEGSMYVKAASNLLMATKKIKAQSQQLMNANEVLSSSVGDLNNRLQQAESCADTAINDRKSIAERILELEKDLENSQEIYRGMKTTLEHSQEKENILREEVAELSSRQIASAEEDKGTSKIFFQEGQAEAIIDKVNSVMISKLLIQEINFSNPMEKLFYILDSFAWLQNQVDTLTSEKENMQSTLDSHVGEIEQQKKVAENLRKSYHVLESKNAELNEAVGLEKLIKKYGRDVQKVAEILSLDDQLDTEMLIIKCLSAVSEQLDASVIERQKFEEIQALLYVKYQEQMLCESILAEDTNSLSEMSALSNELKKTSEEVATLRLEKETLQKELERVEEKSALIREKLSIAVKKGKGLVQEREGFKHSLDEKSSEIKRLTEELKNQESVIFEYKQQIDLLSAYPERIQKLESEIISLDELHQKLVDTIKEIVIPTNNFFENPVDKLHWIAEYIRESETNKVCVQEELEEVKSEASKYSEALATIENLKKELSTAEHNIFQISQGREELENTVENLKEVTTMQARKLEDANATIRSLEDQLAKLKEELEKSKEERSVYISRLEDSSAAINSLEDQLAKLKEELEKSKEERSLYISRLEDSSAAINSLEDALAQSSKRASNLEAEKNEIKDNLQQQLDALNEELSTEFKNLYMIVRDEGLFSLMTEEFRKKVAVLSNTGSLIQDLHNQFIAKGLHYQADFEVSSVAKILSLPKFEDFMNSETFKRSTDIEEFHEAIDLPKYIEALRHKSTLLTNCFQSFSQYADDYIETISHDVKAIHDEFIHTLELNESLKKYIAKFESENQAYEAKISSLIKDTSSLHSACQETINELQMEFNTLLEFNKEEMTGSSNLGSEYIEELEGTTYLKAADSLLLATKRIKTQVQQLMNANKVLAISVDDLTHNLQETKLNADGAIKGIKSREDKILELEKDLKELQEIYWDLKTKLDDSQAKENILREKEEELSSRLIALAEKDKETRETVFQEGQLETLIEKVNNVVISKSVIQEVNFSNPVEKLFYILDSFPQLQKQVDAFISEREDMQSVLDSRVSEIEKQKEATENMGKSYQDLESKKIDLIELTSGLEKLIKKFGGNNMLDDEQPVTVNGLLTSLERTIVTSNDELDISISRMQESGAKLKALEKTVDELSSKNKQLEDSIHARTLQPDIIKERSGFDASVSATGSEISEIEDVGTSGKSTISPPAAHVRTLRKGSNDHLVLNIDSDTDRLISANANETDDKGHVLKSLNASGLIPKQAKLIADRMDGIWVSGGRILMNRPRARLGLIAYWIFLHLWLVGTIL